ncbi:MULTISPECIES: FmdB family zinc ribbon protein [Carboxydothermus]|uniref:FmdB family regulatory protein n=2 Tax=Carboxydothermus TaxID=129957 RepID=A0ABX2R5J4_9THEO|nr:MULTISPECIES: zinc ribbon domain-containing protein [Carboxydothermus]ABB13704.1 conserved hypothetical protein [Carboxydothermus hydrogenoformans Z-2901]NYE56433.1 putative FmdB family regulatory protein [Carboxydothermus ferrireducens DSM 11255]
MPRYDFRCEDCGEKFTAWASINDRDKVVCPKCESNRVKQLLTGFGIIGGSQSSSSLSSAGSSGCTSFG